MAIDTKLIEWSQELTVGIDSIDSQHKKLVNMINALDEGLALGHSDEVLTKVFKGLLAYTDHHFSYEEQLFDQHGYKDTPAHRAEHDALRQQVIDLKDKMEAGGFMLGIETMNFLKSWLTNHILKSDAAYAPFLICRGVV